MCSPHLAGANLAVVVASVPEGHDKPYKYPGMFAAADVVVLNKADLLEVFEFDVDDFRRGLEMVNPGVPFFVLSCRTGAGVEEWAAWLLAQRRAFVDGTTATAGGSRQDLAGPVAVEQGR